MRQHFGIDRRTGRKADAFRYLFVFAAVLALAACSKPASSANPPNFGKATPVASGPITYPLTGEVISIDADRKLVTVRHGEIKDYMPGMTMPFAVSASDLANLKPGEHIRAEMIPSKDSDFRLEKIWPDEQAAVAAVAAGAHALRQDTLIRGNGAYREVGEMAPEFALFDQTGQVVQSSRFRGKQIMLNFIYSRCPVATMCPAATVKMMVAQKQAREAGIPNIEFISITLEPDYDTPGVLRKYAEDRGIDTSNFSFLTGPDPAINDLLVQFGVLNELKGEVRAHTLATLLIDANGKIIHRVDGSQWEPKEFVSKMRR